MVTFYPIRKLKKGKKDAQLRTFFSKNDYISQDLTVEKVKWLTAAYDRMYDISLYEHHWDYKESTGRWTPNMFFWTDADIDRMRSFFKEWSTEKDARDWTAVTRFQDMVKQKRLDERHGACVPWTEFNQKMLFRKNSDNTECVNKDKSINIPKGSQENS